MPTDPMTTLDDNHLESLWQRVRASIDAGTATGTAPRRKRQTASALVAAMASVATFLIASTAFGISIPFLDFSEGSAKHHTGAIEDQRLPEVSEATRDRFAEHGRLVESNTNGPANQASDVDYVPRVLIEDGHLTIAAHATSDGGVCFMVETDGRPGGVTCSGKLHTIGVIYGLDIQLDPAGPTYVLSGLYADQVKELAVVGPDGAPSTVAMDHNGFIWTGSTAPQKLVVRDSTGKRELSLPDASAAEQRLGT